MKKKVKMNTQAVKRIQKATTKNNNGKTPKGSFAAKAQRTISKKR